MTRHIVTKISLLSFLLVSVLGAGAQAPAYEIKANIKPFKHGYLFLAHHYGKKQYLVDSARIDEQGNAIFTGKCRASISARTPAFQCIRCTCQMPKLISTAHPARPIRIGKNILRSIKASKSKTRAR